MRFVIEFDTDNAAFEYDWDGEVHAVCKRIATAISRGQVSAEHGVNTFRVRDTNGNTIGRVTALDEAESAMARDIGGGWDNG